ncbi:MAG: PQQ-binding-like beta-propeller repeat protein [Planctomycetes bacterium]|nr:PQQ-binding-like beta-propeller repeat protein [Planctomycetota bacterium]MBL7043455.1 PQQ-binding-like beta-propeller repeat protein [Pirellulaceae bacterium]
MSIAVLHTCAIGLEQRHDIINFATLILAVLALMTPLVWFVVFGAYSAGARYATVAAVTMAVVVLAGMLRVRQVSGDLVPVLTFRWNADADQSLATPDTIVGGVDLVTTTEYDFPQFLGPDRNATVGGVSLSRDWSVAPRLLWRQPIGAGWSAFAVVNGFAVTMEQRGEQELVTCYEVSTGRLRWWHAVEGRHRTVMGGPGPRATPTIHEGRVYALGATGVLRCLDGADGREIWSDNLLARIGVTPDEDRKAVGWGRSASPLIVDGLVVVPLGGPSGGQCDSLAAYDKHTGRLVWKGGNHQVAYASPSLATIHGVRQILIVNQDFVSGHLPENGEVLWEYPWPGKSTTNANVSQAVPLPNQRIWLSKGYGVGAKVLQLSHSGAGDWGVAELWSSERILHTKFTNIVVRDRYVYGLSDGILQCADLESEKRQWRGGRYAHGQILGVGDLLLVQAESGDVVLVEATPSGHNELGSFPALAGKTWNNPCLYDHYLLVRNAEEAACYELP